MQADRFATPTWWEALTLAERAASLADGDVRRGLAEELRARGERRLARWRDQPPFADGDYFARRLQMDGIDPASLVTLLGESVTQLHTRMGHAPAWLEELGAAYTHALASASGLTADQSEPDAAGEEVAEAQDGAPVEELYDFLELIRPLIDHACDRLQAGVTDLIEQRHPLPFDPSTLEDILLINIPDPLLMRISRTLVLELHVARLQGDLHGDTPKARFQSFITRLRQPEVAIAILAEYPVLARQLILFLEHWTTVCLEFLTRLCEDWNLIRSRFCPEEEPGLLVDLIGGAGDTHRGGRSVMIAEFGSGFQIVYKPKSLSIDVHFQELLTWLNQKGCRPQLQPVIVVDRGTYGWVEFVARQTCRTRDELVRFYQRHGAYLALLYALNSNDFHLENLIAVGEQPILIDLETLLQPQFDTFDEALADSAADKVMSESVMQVGVLPLRLWSNDEYGGIDISGLGGMAGQLSPDRIPRLADAGTDAMRYVRERIELPGDSNRPTLNGVEISATEHTEDIVTGFVHMYDLLVTHREQLAASDGPLAPFVHDEIRVLLRPTRSYDQLLTESFHPDVLRSALDRDQLLDRLWISVLDRPYLAHVVKAEQIDICLGDIPIFTSEPASLDLHSALGVRIPGVLHETGTASVQRRIEQLGASDLRRQVWFIRASLATLDAYAGPPPLMSSQRVATKSPVALADKARLMAGARKIADYLAATAIQGDEDATWIGLDLWNGQHWMIRSSGFDLYGGVAGIALFLAYAGVTLEDARYTQLARRALHTLIRQMDYLSLDLIEIGAYSGWGGLLYVFTHLGALWGHTSLIAHAETIVARVAELVSQDDKFDVGRGAAGAILALLALHASVPAAATLQVACACGDHLLAAAQPTPHGLAWSIPGLGQKPLVGLGHGCAGIAWALQALAAASGSSVYDLAAQQALAHENSLNSQRADEHPAFATSRGLAQLGVLRHGNDAQVVDEVRSLVERVLSRGVESSHALDLGAMGSLEFLLQAQASSQDTDIGVRMGELTAELLDDIAVKGPQCGGPRGVEMPGLMLGVAGIGYQMLRLAAPDQIPAMLLLAPPSAATQQAVAFPVAYDNLSESAAA